MKQILFLLLSALLAATTALSRTEVNGIVYDFAGTNAEVASYPTISYEGHVVIPATFEYEGVTYTVTAIQSHAFTNSSELISVTIPGSITKIGYSAFNNCSKLTTINYNAVNCAEAGDILTQGIPGLGGAIYHASPFNECPALTTVNIGKEVVSLPLGLFSGCGNLSTVNYNAVNCTKAGGYYYGYNGLYQYFFVTVFANCDKLSTFTINSEVKTIPATLCKNLPELTSVSIPDQVSGIGNQAFSGCVKLASASFGNGVTSIGDSAFYNCASLKSVTLPNSTQIVGSYAFHECSELASATLGSKVTRIGRNAFSNCRMLDSFIVPNSVTSIGHYAFSGCSGLTSLTLGNSLKTIGANAFSDCVGITSVILPNSLTIIGESAFSDCSGITTITIPESVQVIGEPGSDGPIVYGGGAFLNCTRLTTVNFNAINCISMSDNNYSTPTFSGCTLFTSLHIGNQVTKIPDMAFKGCNALTSVVIPDGVTYVGRRAFQSCSSLTSATIGNGVSNVEEGAFYGCSSLTTVSIGSRVTAVGDNAFYNCTKLQKIRALPVMPPTSYDKTFYGVGQFTCKLYVPQNSKQYYVVARGWRDFFYIEEEEGGEPVSDFEIVNGILVKYNGEGGHVVIPDSVTSIGNDAFRGCNGLLSVKIPESVSSIGNSVFWGCDNLASITIPAGVTSIGEEVFSGCSSLTAIEVEALNPAYCSADGVLFNKDKTTLIACPRMKAGSYVIPDGVTTIGTKAFYICSFLTSVDTPASLTDIGDYAFSYCGYITSFNIPEGVTVINDGVFDNCSGLTSITIPKQITTIGSYAFAGCTLLKDIFCEGIQPPVCLSSVTFLNVNKTGCTLHVPVNSRQYYEIADGWKEFPNILEEGEPGSDFEIENGVLVRYNGKGGHVIIPDDVTSIGGSAFEGCNELLSVKIPDGVTRIEGYAFWGCGKLTSVTIPAKVESIGDWVFSACSSLTAIEVEASNPAYYSVDGVLFNKGRTRLISCPPGKTGEYVIPDGVTSLGTGAFYLCRSLTAIDMPDSLTDMGNYTFRFCGEVSTFNIPKGVTGINEGVFEDCSGLVSFTIPEQITSIGGYAFAGCYRLKEIYCQSAQPPVCYGEELTFKDIDKNECTLHVPANSRQYYEIAGGWKEFPNIAEEKTIVQVIPSGKSVTIVWTPVEEAEKYLVAIYSDENRTQEVGRFEIDRNGNILLRSTHGVLSCTISGLDTETPYFYSINSYGTGGVVLDISKGNFTTGKNTGITDLSLKKIVLYPNPATDGFYIKGLTEPQEVVLTGLSGRVWIRKVVREGEFIPTDYLPAGIYLVHTGKTTAKLVVR